MTDIANQWTNEHERTKYLQAADRFRLPFWDPLLPRNKVTPIIGKDLNNKIWGAPLILTKPKVYVKKPNEKTQTEIDNPLASFKWPIEELKKKGRVPINGDVTKRLPDVSLSSHPQKCADHSMISGLDADSPPSEAKSH